MKYTVRIAERAQKDIEEAADYIEYALKNPQAADSLLDELDSVLSGAAATESRAYLIDSGEGLPPFLQGNE